jgi:hypothetical protein
MQDDKQLDGAAAQRSPLAALEVMKQIAGDLRLADGWTCEDVRSEVLAILAIHGFIKMLIEGGHGK